MYVHTYVHASCLHLVYMGRVEIMLTSHGSVAACGGGNNCLVRVVRHHLVLRFVGTHQKVHLGGGWRGITKPSVYHDCVGRMHTVISI